MHEWTVSELFWIALIQLSGTGNHGTILLFQSCYWEYVQGIEKFKSLQFDILEKYRKSFNESELGRLHSMFHAWQKNGLSEQRLGRRNIFSHSAKITLMILKAYTGFSDRLLMERLNRNIHYQMFYGIRNEMASRFDIGSLRKIPASHWKPYLDNLQVCMTNADYSLSPLYAILLFRDIYWRFS